jgi:TRAP-type C4-dicarboxylate transport system permease small subunit
MSDRWFSRSARVMEFLMALALAVMAVLVFGNVLLRYGFNSGIAESEDIARLLFVWLSFMGAVVAMGEHAHLGMDTVAKMLPHAGRVGFAIVSHLLMLGALGLLLYGSIQQVVLNHGTLAMGAVAYPLSWLYAAGVFASVGCLLLVAANLLRIVRGKLRDEELVLVQDQEAAVEAELAAHAQDLQIADARHAHGADSGGQRP